MRRQVEGRRGGEVVFFFKLINEVFPHGHVAARRCDKHGVIVGWASDNGPEMLAAKNLFGSARDSNACFGVGLTADGKFAAGEDIQVDEGVFVALPNREGAFDDFRAAKESNQFLSGGGSARASSAGMVNGNIKPPLVISDTALARTRRNEGQQGDYSKDENSLWHGSVPQNSDLTSGTSAMFTRPGSF